MFESHLKKGQGNCTTKSKERFFQLDCCFFYIIFIATKLNDPQILCIVMHMDTCSCFVIILNCMHILWCSERLHSVTYIALSVHAFPGNRTHGVCNVLLFELQEFSRTRFLSADLLLFIRSLYHSNKEVKKDSKAQCWTVWKLYVHSISVYLTIYASKLKNQSKISLNDGAGDLQAGSYSSTPAMCLS